MALHFSLSNQLDHESQPGQAEADTQVKDVSQTPKSSSKSSVKSKSSKTSLKSISASVVSAKNETVTEVRKHLRTYIATKLFA